LVVQNSSDHAVRSSRRLASTARPRARASFSGQSANGTWWQVTHLRLSRQTSELLSRNGRLRSTAWRTWAGVGARAAGAGRVAARRRSGVTEGSSAGWVEGRAEVSPAAARLAVRVVYRAPSHRAHHVLADHLLLARGSCPSGRRGGPAWDVSPDLRFD